MRGRNIEIDDENAIETLQFGEHRVSKSISGIELLKKAEKIDKDVNLAAMRILDDKDFKKMKILKLKKGVG